jgi:hypothetical protein
LLPSPIACLASTSDSRVLRNRNTTNWNAATVP